LAVRSIASRSAGKTETRSRPRRKVVVSRPGDAPNTDRGRLISSVQFAFDKARMVGTVFSGLKYARWLEFGTRKMKARPWLRPAFKAGTRNIKDLVLKRGIIKVG